MTTYYERNKERLLKQANEYYAKNKERVKEYQAAYRCTPESKEYQKEYSTHWRKVNREKILWLGARKRAKDRNIEFTIEETDIIIPATCPVLGIPIVRTIDKQACSGSPSLDRIDSNKGYIKGNIRVISFRANTLKNNASVEELTLILEDSLKINKL